MGRKGKKLNKWEEGKWETAAAGNLPAFCCFARIRGRWAVWCFSALLWHE